VADQYQWGFANINLRAYYAEGAKTYGFEIAEQLGWRLPRHVVSPVAGGTLLPRILKGFEELRRLGLVQDELPAIYAAQAAGCAPVVNALEQGPEIEFPDPVKPNTIAKSIAIGNPADGFQVLSAVRSTGGRGAAVEEHEIIEGIQLLAETEGIFTEPAGGVTVAATRQLVQRGAIGGDDPIVICVTGNGYKTAEVLNGRGVEPIRIGRSLAEFEAIQAAAAGTVQA
jgi:threonine synthase